jgi:hypothetical protein
MREGIALRIPASRKPRAYIRVRPFDVYVSPVAAAGKTSLFFMPRHMTSRAHLVIRRDALNAPCFSASP